VTSFEVGEAGADKILKTYEMVLASDGNAVRMQTGARIPIPTTSFKVSDDGTKVAAPVTSYTYQHVGFSARIAATLNENGTIRLRGNIEDSTLTGSPTADGRPFIQSMDQNLALTLADGRPMRISRVDETGTRSLFIQIRADLLDDAGQRLSSN